MDDKLLNTLLHDITQQEIPDDMQSLWPDIERKLDSKPARRVLQLTRLGWVTAVVVLSLVLGAGAYAVVQINGNNDPGMRRIQEQELVTPIDESITIDGITVTLDWAYADANRIALSYHATSDVTYEGDTPPDDLPLAIGPVMPGDLVDDQGHTFPILFGGGGSGGVTNTEAGPDTTTASLLAEANINFDTTALEKTPESLVLTYEILVGVQTERLEPGPDSGTSAAGGGGGGGGGGSADDAAAGETPPMPDFAQNVVGPFVFEFTVPVYQAVELTPDETIEANGVSVTLESVAVAPSMTRVDLCTDGLPDDRAWRPSGMLATSDEPESGIGTGRLIEQDDPNRQCYMIMFLSAYDFTAQDWSLTIESLEIPAQPTAEQMQTLLAEYGIEVEMIDENGWQATHVPEDVDFGEAMNEVLAELTETIDGPWTFELAVPATER